MNTTDIINHDKQDYFPVFARYDIVLDHGDGPYYTILTVKPI